MNTYIVEYTNEDLTGNQVMTMEITAHSLAAAWDIVEEHYGHIAVDSIYAASDGYEDGIEYDGQPDEYTEWMDYDPDC